MTQRGRKSAAKLAVAASNDGQSNVTVLGSTRPPPPDIFKRNSREYVLWNLIVNAQVADYFTTGDLPLLEAYCRIVSRHEQVSDAADAAEYTVTSAQGTEVVNPIFRLQGLLTQQMATLSVKLRLAASTRYDEKKAATLARRAAEGDNGAKAKPWQRG